MKIKYIDFTSLEALTLIPIVNTVITLHENVFERNIELLDVKKLAYLKDMVSLLRDGIDLDLDVVIEVRDCYYYEFQLFKDMILNISALLQPEMKSTYISLAVKLDKLLQFYSHVKAVKS